MLGQLAQGDQAADQGFRGRHHDRTGLAHSTQIDQHVGLVGAVFDLLYEIRPAAGEGEGLAPCCCRAGRGHGVGE